MVARFTLLDDVYYDAIIAVGDAFGRSELPFCLVGGGASQIWIASLMSGAGERRISTEATLPTLLRATRDADFSTRCDPGRALAVMNNLASHSSRPAHVLGPRTMRLGAVQVSLTVEPSDLVGMADRYDRLLESRESVRVRRGRAPVSVPVIGLEALIATKLTRRGDKAKDILDVGNLLAAARSAGRSVDAETVSPYLGSDREAERLLMELMGGKDD